MVLEKQNNSILFNGTPADRKSLNRVFKKCFSPSSLERLWQDLDRFGRVHVSFVFVNAEAARQNAANKKIAALENCVAQLTEKVMYLESKE